MKKSLIKPRNPLILASQGRGGAGRHGKSRKAQRRADKIETKRGGYDA